MSDALAGSLYAGMEPMTTYYYQVGDPRWYYGMSETFSFTTVGLHPPTNKTLGSYQLPFK